MASDSSTRTSKLPYSLRLNLLFSNKVNMDKWWSLQNFRKPSEEFYWQKSFIRINKKSHQYFHPAVTVWSISVYRAWWECAHVSTVSQQAPSLHRLTFWASLCFAALLFGVKCFFMHLKGKPRERVYTVNSWHLWIRERRKSSSAPLGGEGGAESETVGLFAVKYGLIGHFCIRFI